MCVNAAVTVIVVMAKYAVIRTIHVAQIQVLTAADQMKPAVKAPVVVRVRSVVPEVIAVKMMKSAVMAIAVTLTYAKNVWMATASISAVIAKSPETGQTGGPLHLVAIYTMAHTNIIPERIVRTATT